MSKNAQIQCIFQKFEISKFENFPTHGELHKLERKFNKHPGEEVKGLMSSQKYERMYP